MRAVIVFDSTGPHPHRALWITNGPRGVPQAHSGPSTLRAARRRRCDGRTRKSGGDTTRLRLLEALA
jgi:hypothetical protein